MGACGFVTSGLWGLVGVWMVFGFGFWMGVDYGLEVGCG